MHIILNIYVIDFGQPRAVSCLFTWERRQSGRRGVRRRRRRPTPPSLLSPLRPRRRPPTASVAGPPRCCQLASAPASDCRRAGRETGCRRHRRRRRTTAARRPDCGTGRGRARQVAPPPAGDTSLPGGCASRRTPRGRTANRSRRPTSTWLAARHRHRHRRRRRRHRRRRSSNNSRWRCSLASLSAPPSGNRWRRRSASVSHRSTCPARWAAGSRGTRAAWPGAAAWWPRRANAAGRLGGQRTGHSGRAAEAADSRTRHVRDTASCSHKMVQILFVLTIENGSRFVIILHRTYNKKWVKYYVC